mmetsp:Transcript_27214/g.49756  ORF Transcript_27214/g.49756 Transcript_27214/m.49756 type:complete len:380 (-) Transcript_27214:71-1210(-)
MGHQRADRGGSGVELRHFVLFADLPEAAGVGIGGHAFEHERRGPVGKRAVNDIAVAGDPAHIRSAPEHVPILVIKDNFVGHGGVNEIAARAVDNPFGLTGGAGGVEDEERIFGGHFLGRAILCGLGGGLVQPDIKTVAPGNLLAGALDHQTFRGVDHVDQRLVHVVLEVGHPAPARGTIGSDHHLGITARNARRQCVGREARKNDGMDRADARAGQHGIGRLGDHRQIKHDPVAFAHAHAFEDIGHFTGLRVQFAVADVLCPVLRAVGFPDDRRLLAARLKVPVDTVGGNVQRAVGVPVDRDIPQRVVDIFDLGVGLDPIDPLALLAPERIRIGKGSRIHRVIFCRIHMGIGRHIGGWGIGFAVGHGRSSGDRLVDYGG